MLYGPSRGQYCVNTGAKPRITYAMLFRFLVVKEHPGLQQVSIRNTFGDTIVFLIQADTQMDSERLHVIGALVVVGEGAGISSEVRLDSRRRSK